MNTKRKIVAIITVRAGSVRLKRKALLKIAGQTTLGILINRLRSSFMLDDIVIATPDDKENDPIVKISKKYNVSCSQAPYGNYAYELVKAAKLVKASTIVRVTGDDLLRCITHLDLSIKSHLKNRAEYTYVTGLPFGVDSEVIELSAIEYLSKHANVPQNTSFLSWYFNEKEHNINKIPALKKYSNKYRFSLDYQDDFELFKVIFENFNEKVSLDEVIKFLNQNHVKYGLSKNSPVPPVTKKDLDLTVNH